MSSRHRFVSSDQLAQRIREMIRACDADGLGSGFDYLNCCVDHAEVLRDCEAFAASLKDVSLRDPHAFLSAYDAEENSGGVEAEGA